MRRTLNRLLFRLRRRPGLYIQRSPCAPQDLPIEVRRRRWFTTGEIRRNRRDTW